MELEGIKHVVHLLHTALHLPEHHLLTERQLLERLDNLKQQLSPLEKVADVSLSPSLPSDFFCCVVTDPFLTDEGPAVPYGRLPELQGCLGRLGAVIRAGWRSGLAHLVGLFMGRHGAGHILHHLRHSPK